MSREYLTKTPSQTQKIGENIAQRIINQKPSGKAFILALEGDLGGGKTTFLQGLAKGLKIKEKILSPTFVILKKFNLKNSSFTTFYHIDCYRIEKPKEILALDFKDIIADPKNIVAVEWAERIKKILPQDKLSINFEFISQDKRKILIKWPKRKN